MKAKIDPAEKCRRQMCMRKWYFMYKECSRRSSERRMVMKRLGISRQKFYRLLDGVTYIGDNSMQVINNTINRNCIEGLEVDIFAK